MDQSYLAGSQYMLGIPIITSIASVFFFLAYYRKVEGGFAVVQWNAQEEGRAREKGEKKKKKGLSQMAEQTVLCVSDKKGALMCLGEIWIEIHSCASSKEERKGKKSIKR